MMVQSTTGPVDMSKPENVVRGMMFRSNSGILRTVVWHRGSGIFSAIAGTDFAPTDGWTFVGCDPAIAPRIDCERFGIVPQADAGAHGFARTRDGFAVDLRRECLPDGAVVYTKGEGRTAVVFRDYAKPRPLWGHERFTGLDMMRHARSEDMERLCCGEYGPDQIDGGNRSTWAPRCTLAIGDHAQHEDIAAGVKWAAERFPAKRAQVTFSALLKEYDGRQREHDPRCPRGIHIIACLFHNQDVRSLAKHLETLGGTWHPGSRRAQWPGGSLVHATTYDRAERDARGLRVDVLVGMSTDPWGSLDYHGLRMMVSAHEAPAFWGMRSLDQKVASMAREMAYRSRAGVFAREWDGQFVEGRESGNVTPTAVDRGLAESRADTGFRPVVMAGTPLRKSGLLYDAVDRAMAKTGVARVLTLSMGTIRIGEHDVNCQVRRREDGQMEVMFPAHPAVRIEPQVDRYEVTIGGEKVTGIVLEGHVEGDMLSNPTVRLTMAEVPNAPEMKPLSEEQKGRLAEWTDGMVRQLHATRKALAGQTAEARMLTKALRVALPDVDRLPWDLVDRKPLHAAAHALCEMAEAATGGGGNGSALRPMLGEMLGILRAAEHLPPATARQMAERTLEAARKAWPRGKK